MVKRKCFHQNQKGNSLPALHKGSEVLEKGARQKELEKDGRETEIE